MKAIRLFIFLPTICLWLLSGCASGVDSSAPYAALKWTDAGFSGHGISVEIEAVDAQKVSVLTSYSYVRITPGKHDIKLHCFNANYDGSTQVTVTVEAGKTYRFEGVYTAGEFAFNFVEDAPGEKIARGSFTAAGVFRPSKIDIPIFLGK